MRVYEELVTLWIPTRDDYHRDNDIPDELADALEITWNDHALVQDKITEFLRAKNKANAV